MVFWNLTSPQNDHRYHPHSTVGLKVLCWWRPHAKWKTLWPQSFDEIRRAPSKIDWCSDTAAEKKRLNLWFFSEATRRELYWISDNSVRNLSKNYWNLNKKMGSCRKIFLSAERSGGPIYILHFRRKKSQVPKDYHFILHLINYIN